MWCADSQLLLLVLILLMLQWGWRRAGHTVETMLTYRRHCCRCNGTCTSSNAGLSTCWPRNEVYRVPHRARCGPSSSCCCSTCRCCCSRHASINRQPGGTSTSTTATRGRTLLCQPCKRLLSKRGFQGHDSSKCSFRFTELLLRVTVAMPLLTTSPAPALAASIPTILSFFFAVLILIIATCTAAAV